MAYYNRKNQLINTLNSFVNLYSKRNDFEIVIVDDNSSKEEQLYEVINKFKFKIKYYFIDAKEKGDNINPCVVYNKGFSMCEGDIIVIQNPECLHYTDILGEIKMRDLLANYVTVPVITSPSFQENVKIFSFLTNDVHQHRTIRYLERQNANSILKGWYNHKYLNLSHLHFCSVILRDNLDILNGFDETYGKNYWYDDNEFLAT